MIITCAVLDDEPLALELLKSYAMRTPFLQLTHAFSSAVEAIDALRDAPVQLIFADIQMPDLDGLSFAKLLPPATRVVFTTAFSQYAIDGYKTRAVDYLLKPFSYADFLGAAQKALEWFELVERAQAPTEAGAPGEPDALFIKSDYKLVRVRHDDILYVEGLKDYVKIYTDAQARPILSLTTMKQLEECLPAGRFMRIHRSYIVNLRRVEVVERSHLVVGGKQLPVSDSYREALMAYINRHLP